MSLPTQVYSELLDSLYTTTLDPSQWTHFLDRLCTATDSVIALLVRNDNGMGRRFVASGGLALPAGEHGYSTADPVREAFMRKPAIGVIEVEDFLPHDELVRSEYYPVMAALGVTYGTCIVPTLSVRRYDLISLWRGGNRPRLDPGLIALLTLLFPHIRNALAIQSALGASEQRAHNAEAILDTSSTVSLLLNASGRLLYANHAGRRLLENSDGLVEHEGRVIPARAERRSEFQQLLTGVGSWDYPVGAMSLERDSDRPPLHLMINPLYGKGSRHAGRILVLAVDPQHTAQLPNLVLHQLYGLTPAETEIANGLLTGFAPEAIAAIRGVSVQTVRSQVRSILAKTGTQRQMDLVRLLSALPGATAIGSEA